ncbi:MAG TPA: phosphatase PAP2 family protein, partial [Actinomycetes bacterium]|nr:phosphatase PAP2 family protein [Actinomycetes bacterium]
MRTTVTATRPRAGRELALLAALYVAYSAARLLTDPDLGAATANARDLLHIEAVSGLDVERWLNEGLSALPVLPLVASYWYSLLHYAVTPAVLVWVYRAHPDRYRVARNSLVIGSALGIAGFALLPTAPPRMLPGYVDTPASTAGSGWWGSDASAPRGLGGLTNELAAMPSLHVGWALWCAVVVWWCT